MTVVRCNQSDCANRGKEVCTADRVTFEDGDCKQMITFEQMMRSKPVGHCKRECGKWKQHSVNVAR